MGILLVLLLAHSCKNPFATREAEPPTEGRTSWQFPTDPMIVLQNMKYAIEEKNVENYMKCLVDSNAIFHFEPDQFEASTNAGIFDFWNLSREQTYINRVFTAIPDDSVRTLIYSNIQRSYFPDSAYVQADYQLDLHHILSQSYPRQGKGQLDFWFLRRNGYWVISRWYDHDTKLDSTSARLPSWSTIKAGFSN